MEAGTSGDVPVLRTPKTFGTSADYIPVTRDTVGRMIDLRLHQGPLSPAECASASETLKTDGPQATVALMSAMMQPYLDAQDDERRKMQ